MTYFSKNLQHSQAKVQPWWHKPCLYEHSFCTRLYAHSTISSACTHAMNCYVCLWIETYAKKAKIQKLNIWTKYYVSDSSTKQNVYQIIDTFGFYYSRNNNVRYLWTLLMDNEMCKNKMSSNISKHFVSPRTKCYSLKHTHPWKRKHPPWTSGRLRTVFASMICSVNLYSQWRSFRLLY